MSPETPIVVAKPKEIEQEWRWFIVDGKIVDGSTYRLNGQLVKKHEDNPLVIKSAQQLALSWLPDDCCVMDVARVDGQLKVVEFNCINASGFYDHDKE